MWISLFLHILTVDHKSHQKQEKKNKRRKNAYPKSWTITPHFDVHNAFKITFSGIPSSFKNSIQHKELTVEILSILHCTRNVRRKSTAGNLFYPSAWCGLFFVCWILINKWSRVQLDIFDAVNASCKKVWYGSAKRCLNSARAVFLACLL